MEMDVDVFFKANDQLNTYYDKIGLPFTRSLEELNGEGRINLEKFDYVEIAKKISKLETITTEELFDLFGVKGDARNAANFGNLKYRVTPHLKKLGFNFYKIEGKKGVFQIARNDEAQLDTNQNKKIKAEPKARSKPKAESKPDAVLLEIAANIPTPNADYFTFEKLKKSLISNPEIISKINELFDAQDFGLEFVITGIELRKKVVANEPND